tara:strand:+ start:337 stop:918 length:582 start_codon:yes stop_codon:yes gene_type:complete
MVDQLDKHKLFIVVLGGRTNTSHIELHDVRWVVGRQIEDTFFQLRHQWFGNNEGLHIDSYVEIRFIDGYKIFLQHNSKSKVNEITNIKKMNCVTKSLWFVNLGGYSPEKLNESHEFGLFVAESAYEARTLAKKRLLKGMRQIHKDDISRINQIDLIDDLYPLKLIDGWEVHLIPDPKCRSQKLSPDWYGYFKI